MGIRILDERHKTLAEELLKGTPRSKIAERVGVDRTTLYKWMKDPIFQAYFEKLGSDLHEARSMRLLVTVMKMAEVAENYLDFVLTELATEDPDRIRQLPSLDSISSALKRMVELERLDGGQPTSITRREEKEAASDEMPEEHKDKAKRLLNDLVSNEEEIQH